MTCEVFRTKSKSGEELRHTEDQKTSSSSIDPNASIVKRRDFSKAIRRTRRLLRTLRPFRTADKILDESIKRLSYNGQSPLCANTGQSIPDIHKFNNFSDYESSPNMTFTHPHNRNQEQILFSNALINGRANPGKNTDNDNTEMVYDHGDGEYCMNRRLTNAFVTENDSEDLTTYEFIEYTSNYERHQATSHNKGVIRDE